MRKLSSRSACQNDDQKYIVDSGASLQMMSGDALTILYKDTKRKSGDLTIIVIANGMAGSTGEVIVYINDLDVFVTMMLMEGSPTFYSGFIMRRNGLLFRMEQGRVSIVDQCGKVIRCKSENHEPTVAVLKNFVYPTSPPRRRGTDCEP